MAKHLLIVDDEAAIRDSLRMILEYEGYVVHEAPGGEEATNILSEICSSLEHLDVVITDVLMPNYDGRQLCTWIRNSQLLYSFGNFRLSSIPILMITGARIPVSLPSGFVALMEKPLQRIVFLENIESLINKWRKAVLDELEILGIGIEFNFDRFEIKFAARVKSKTSILSPRFLKKKRPLPYIWLSKDLFALEASLEELEALLNLSASRQGAVSERTFHDFFLRNPHFILRERYSEYWSEPSLKIPGTQNYLKPDFILKPHINSHLGSRWEVADLKLPNDKILSRSQFHKTFSARFVKSVSQLLDYRSYFLREDVKKAVKERLGFHPRYPKLALIMGRFDEISGYDDMISSRLRDLGLADLQLISYDELLDARKAAFERALNERSSLIG